MKISKKSMDNYIKKLSAINRKAGEEMQAFIDLYGIKDRDALIAYAYSLASRYGEGASALACEYFDSVMDLEGYISNAEPADTATYAETAKAVNGSLKQSTAGLLIAGVVSRLVKQAGEDTILKNAIYYKVEVAWLPSGDSCPFCLMLASQGWKKASAQAYKNGHAQHIHGNCDCTHAIRKSKNTEYESYDPNKYKEIFENAEGHTDKEKMDSLERLNYQKNKEAINERKRAEYAARKMGNLINQDLI